MLKYNVKLNNGNEALNVNEKTVTADPADGTSGNQGNNPNPGSGDDGMS